MGIGEFCYVLTAAVVLRAIERMSGSGLVSPWPLAEIARTALHLGAAGAFLALTGRPILALILLVTSAAALSAANLAKIRLLGESMVFSDAFLLPQVLRHPRLYYLHRAIPALTAATTLLIGIVAASVWLEPSVGAVSGLLIVAFSFAALVVVAPICARRHVALLQDPDAGWGSLAFGVPTALVMQLCGWLGQARTATLRRYPPLPSGTDLVVLQLESFVDLPARGIADASLEGWQRLRQRAVACGRLAIDARGANTTRTEFSVITGLGGAALGFDRFQPYLKAAPYGPQSHLEALRRAGWDTVFIHPFDGTFFNRRGALPTLGASRLVFGDAFDDAPRAGTYVADLAVADRIVAELDASAGPACIFAVTMENHGPWDSIDPVASYIEHAGNGLMALESLIHRLAKRERECVVLVYGDHVPALAALGSTLADGTTDYMLIDPKQVAETPGHVVDHRPEAIFQLAIDYMAADTYRSYRSDNAFRRAFAYGVNS